MTMKAGIVFPHQLFEEIPFSKGCDLIYLLEEHLFFNQYPFHKQKLAYHRATMKFYEKYLTDRGWRVQYIDSASKEADARALVKMLAQKGINSLEIIDVADNWLWKRIRQAAGQSGIAVEELPSPLFINAKAEAISFFEGKKAFRQTDFYIWQRKKHHIMVDVSGKPEGGKWTFDSENRKKYPAGKLPPIVDFPGPTVYSIEASHYVEKHFPGNYGTISSKVRFPVTFDDAKDFLDQFLDRRFHDYGTYQDAMIQGQSFMHHSLISPMLNNGLLTPAHVIERVLSHAREKQVPLNSLEGFVRQVLGWREFIRGVYEVSGSRQRTRNFWGFERKIPESFWNGSTGIFPVDQCIENLLETGYNHHIERLMVLGNIMVLCEFDPDEVYRWFMTLYIDAYDWVMVPNVYGMSQFADGGLMSSKPYISGSNYLLKMSNFKKGNWQPLWDALFWRFMHVHRDFFSSNPRLGMLVRSFDKMDRAEQDQLLGDAESFLETL